MKRIRVVYGISTLLRCGPVRVLYNIVQNLDRRVFEPWILTFSPEPADTMWAEFESLGCHMQCLGMSRLSMELFGHKELRRLLTEIHPDILHAHGFRACLYFAKYQDLHKTCCTVHNVPQEDFIHTYGFFLGRWMCWKYFSALRKIEARVACSEAVARAIERYTRIEMRFIRNGVALTTLPNMETRLRIRKKLGIPLEAPILLSIGSLTRQKNPRFLVEALNPLLDEINAFCIFLGDGEEREWCEAHCSDRMIFAGHKKNVFSYLSTADLFLSSSRSEGLPNSALEALASGVPVLLSDIEPHKEIVGLDSDVGALFRLDDKCDFSVKLVHFLEALDCSHKLLARKLIERCFSATSMSNEYQQLYKEMVQWGKKIK